MKQYVFNFFVDFLKDENHIDMEKRIRNCVWSDDCKDLRSALYCLYEDVLDWYEVEDKNVLVGISSGRCDGNPIGCSYRNTLIFKDKFLKERFWC